ncbi:MAG: hypothetical protein ACRCR5_09695 [Lactococcus garvieae]
MLKYIKKFVSRIGYSLAFVSIGYLFSMIGSSSLTGLIFLVSFAATCVIYAVEFTLSEAPKIMNKGEK